LARWQRRGISERGSKNTWHKRKKACEKDETCFEKVKKKKQAAKPGATISKGGGGKGVGDGWGGDNRV